VKRLLIALAVAAAVASAGCDPNHGSTRQQPTPKPASSDTQFKNTCRLKGGTPVITRQGGKSQYNCVPPPGGWS
jgi:hypothetical protein